MYVLSGPRLYIILTSVRIHVHPFHYCHPSISPFIYQPFIFPSNHSSFYTFIHLSTIHTYRVKEGAEREEKRSGRNSVRGRKQKERQRERERGEMERMLLCALISTPVNNRTDCGAYAYDYNFLMQHFKLTPTVLYWHFPTWVFYSSPVI